MEMTSKNVSRLADTTILKKLRRYQDISALLREMKAEKECLTADLMPYVGETFGRFDVRKTKVDGRPVAYYQQPYSYIRIVMRKK